MKNLLSILFPIAFGCLTLVSCDDSDDTLEIQAVNDEQEITEKVQLLFNYVDTFNWDGLHNEVMADSVLFDMSSLGQGPAQILSAQQITEAWAINYGNLQVDEVFHLTGNIVVTVTGDEAEAYCYSEATLFREAATQGQTVSFSGDYNLGFVHQANGWRMNYEQYNVRFIQGNPTLE